MTPTVRRAIIPITALALIGVGAAFLWHWSAGVFAIGILTWIEIARAKTT